MKLRNCVTHDSKIVTFSKKNNLLRKQRAQARYADITIFIKKKNQLPADPRRQMRENVFPTNSKASPMLLLLQRVRLSYIFSSFSSATERS